MKPRSLRLSPCGRLWRRHPVLRVIELCVSRHSPVSLLKPHLLHLVGCVLNTDAGMKKYSTEHTGHHNHRPIWCHRSLTPYVSYRLFHPISSFFVQIRSGLMDTDRFSVELGVPNVLFVWIWDGFLNVPLPVWVELGAACSLSSLIEQIAARTQWIIY